MLIKGQKMEDNGGNGEKNDSVYSAVQLVHLNDQWFQVGVGQLQ